MIREVNALIPLNADSPIVVTEFGISNVCNEDIP